VDLRGPGGVGGVGVRVGVEDGVGGGGVVGVGGLGGGGGGGGGGVRMGMKGGIVKRRSSGVEMAHLQPYQ